MAIFDPTPIYPFADSPEDSFFSAKVGRARRYFLDLNPPASASLAVTGGGYEECAPDYEIQRDGFPHIVIEWVLAGAGYATLGGQPVELRVGSVLCYGPRVPHLIRTDPVRPLRKHFVSFTGSDANDICAAAGLSPGASRVVPPDRRLERAFESLIDDGTTASPAAASWCEASLRYLLATLALAPTKHPLKDDAAYATFRRCDDHLQANAERLMSLNQVATECGVSKEHLCRLYKRYGQASPHQRLLRLRMNSAAEKLAMNNETVAEIARELGYEDPFQFSRAFKRAFGMAPSAFRRQFR